MPHINLIHNNLLIFESYCKKMDINGKEISAKISDIPVQLKVASTLKSQSTGYMHEEIPPSKNRGILFIYDEPMPLSFWMKNVRFPLDIVFFDSNMKYINHHTMETADNLSDDQLPKYRSHDPARFAVELPAGWCEKNMTSNCKLSF